MEARIRRSPEAWIKSCEMDPSRKILVVEGIEDRLFIEYLLEEKNSTNSIILEVEDIDIRGNIENGNKGRIVFLAGMVDNTNDNFKCFIDSDYSSFMGMKFPKCVISTDFRDLESYLYEVEFLNKFLKVGLKTNKLTGKKLLQEIDSMRFFGFVRITSVTNFLKLAINKTNEKLSKYIDIDKHFCTKILENEYLQSLIQNTEKKYSKKELTSLLDATLKKYYKSPTKDVVHGKDVISFIKEISTKLGFKKDNIENLFWMSFDKSKVANYPKLSSVVFHLS